VPLAPIDGPYEGTVGRGLRVIVRLKHAEAILTGDYFYEARGVRLKLRGTVTPAGALALDETNAQGKVTGHFEGHQVASGALEGTWSSPDGARKLPFSVTRMQRDIAADPVLITKRVIRKKQAATEPAIGESKPGRCEIDIKYAEISGVPSSVAAKINTRLAAPDLEPCETAYETTRDYDVTLNRNGILSVMVEGYSMYAGAAHSSNFEGFWANFDVTTGEEVTLDQVLRAPLQTTCRKLFAATVNTMTADDATFHDMFEAAFDSPEFVFEPGGMRFTGVRALAHAFQGASADGVMMTYPELAPALDPKSRMRRLWAAE
jgi:hypothetical protein